MKKVFVGSWPEFKKEFLQFCDKYAYKQSFACVTRPDNNDEADHDICWSVISEGQINAIEESLEIMKEQLYKD